MAATMLVQANTRDNGYVRVIHASPDAPAVDVYVNGASILTGFKFGDSTDFVALPAGDYTLEIRPAGAAAASTPAASVAIVLASGISANVTAIGLLNGSGAQALKLEVFTSDRSPLKVRRASRYSMQRPMRPRWTS